MVANKETGDIKCLAVVCLFRYAYEEKDVVVLVKELENSSLKW